MTTTRPATAVAAGTGGGRRLGLALLVIATAQLMVVLDATIVNMALPHIQRALGFSVLRGGEFLTREVSALQREAFGAASGNWSVEYGFHLGGFARRSPALGEFTADFEERHGLALDWVYVGKMMYGIFALAQQGRFPAGTAIVAVITGSGGLQEPAVRGRRAPSHSPVSSR